MVTSDKLKILFFFFHFLFFPKIHLCTNNWHRRETFGYAVGWVSPGEKEKNKTLPTFPGASDAPGRGSSTAAGLGPRPRPRRVTVPPWHSRPRRRTAVAPRVSCPRQPPTIEAFGDGSVKFSRGVAARPSPTPRRFSPFLGDAGGRTAGLCSGGAAGAAVSRSPGRCRGRSHPGTCGAAAGGAAPQPPPSSEAPRSHLLTVSDPPQAPWAAGRDRGGDTAPQHPSPSCGALH